MNCLSRSGLKSGKYHCTCCNMLSVWYLAHGRGYRAQLTRLLDQHRVLRLVRCFSNEAPHNNTPGGCYPLPKLAPTDAFYDRGNTFPLKRFLSDGAP